MDGPAETQSFSRAPRERAPFLPGTVVGGRYRIVALVGQGGMGEVYRADDLKIGQSVALKFLPADLERHPDRLQRLFGEVRIARQVAHPNVCRVYDVGDFDGHNFITMEYVDGEDLAALLRRIGRLPQEKALDLARQIASGLAAAHDQGIVHRDLKPANVMLDGRGRARITDFGLAVAAEAVRGTEAKSGTPGYMAPEQIEGSTITPRTDVYALGLLLHEMSTGRRPKPGDAPRSGLDPATDTLIQRCLEEDPTQRPASAEAFLRALPGGDPLDAALRAGETPSPEMVAAAGQERVLSTRSAWGLFGIALLVIAAAMLAGVKAVGLDQVPMPKSPEVLSERAREIKRALGVGAPPRSTAWWVGVAEGYVGWARAHPQSPLSGTRPAALRFAYRDSPEPIFPWRRDTPSRLDPPMIHAGETFLSLDLQGNLVDFTRVPRQLGQLDTAQVAPADWGALLSLTGVPSNELRAVPPLWTPDVPSDARAAWVMTGGEAPLRIEAASWRGAPVWLRTIEPWERAERETRDPSANPIGLAVFVGLVVAVLVGMAALARYNLRVGRGDRRGAVRVAAAVLFSYVLSSALFFRWELEPRHIWTFLLQRIPYFPALVICLVYLGVEPFLRRRWPHRLIAWTRLLEGKWMDPLVGREALLGLVAGAAGSLVSWLPAIFERHPDADSLLSYLFPMGRAADFWGAMANAPPDGVMKGLGGFAILLLVRFVVRRDSIAWIGFGVLFAGASVLTLNMTPAYWLGLILATSCLVLAARVGVLAAAVGWTTVNLITTCTPLTLDFSRWYAWRTGVIAFLLLALAVWGFRAAMGRRRIFSGSLLEG